VTIFQLLDRWQASQRGELEIWLAGFEVAPTLDEVEWHDEQVDDVPLKIPEL
jgi:hypothetical protein